MIREMPVRDILDLISVEHGEPMRDCLDLINVEDGFHDLIYSQMKKDGINAVPVHVGNLDSMSYYGCTDLLPETDGDAYLGNGHHRVALAFSLGFERMRVTEDPDESYRFDGQIISLQDWSLNGIHDHDHCTGERERAAFGAEPGKHRTGHFADS